MSMRERSGMRQGGFTLIELMIAMVIGLIILLGASQIFLASQQSFERVEQLNDRQEVLRFLADSVSLDVRTADSNMEVTNAGSTLTLLYGESRSEDPYCPGGNLERVDYQFVVETSTLSLTTHCSGIDPIKEPLVSNLELVSFTSGNVNGSVTYIDIFVRFSELDSEATTGREVVFRAASRSAIIAQVNAGS
ncbi:prepilin-type N-terminal cleavage/methylation domain-containing protein [Modicisalibacter xianhensis]|uniref:Prepilin-type N-terminal cleavage/methylation domain-containing protein n=1 Tax=Modicisalibacter xianhensis TaxID=442341 RepID=A0A4R8FJY3_9GAMM|nr:prepilin-type N-terminal cleavage/methylation domain-containing protein [Halomonas xianhensis]TDX24208.1 prepilin-type N-terminal cleavage/methylation domain-containing protein [Halomonas xianhensis]